MRIPVVIIGILSTCSIAYAQQVKTFHDTFGVQGEIRYTGNYIVDSLPKQGAVDIRWRTIDSVHLKTYLTKGNTQNHVPNGVWTWEEARWNYHIRVGDNSQPVFSTNGRRKRWEGRFLKGTPDGRWTFSMDSINNTGRIAANYIKININYKEGKPTGNISYENRLRSVRLSGTLNSDGVATGTWVYNYKNQEGIQVTEERLYTNGLLTQINVTAKSKYTIVLEHNNHFFTNTTSAQPGRVGSLRFAKEEYNTDASDLFFLDFTHYFLGGWQLEAFSYSFDRKGPGFQRLEYPLSNVETEDIRSAKTMIARQKKEIEDHLSSNIHIYRFRNVQIDTTVAYLQLKLERLYYLDSLLTQSDHPEFTYKNREEKELNAWIEELNRNRTTKGEVFDTVKVDIGLLPVSSASIFGQIRNYITNNQKLLSSYFNIVEHAGIAVHREGELKTLEDEMVKKFDDLQNAYADKKGIARIIHERFIKGQVATLLQEFAGTEDYNKAIARSNVLNSMLDSIAHWSDLLEPFDDMPATIRAEYSKMVYNPYSGANDIEIVNKRKFIQNVQTVMWPHMLKELNQTADWDKWVHLWNQQFEVYHYLLNFAARDDASAKRLDRRVRTDKKPERMLQYILDEMKGR